MVTRSHKINISWLLISLIIINTVAHFVPFERASLAPDDYASLLQAKSVEGSDILRQMLDYPDRPLNRLVLMLQAKIVGDNTATALILVFLSTTFVLIFVFFLLYELFADSLSAFIGSVIFCLIPNKLETYHTLIFFNMNTAICIYVLSVLFFIRYVKTRKKPYFMASFFTYGIGIFWYEVGFFLPVIIAAYAFLYEKERVRSTLIFFFLSAAYIAYRLTGVFGLVVSGGSSHDISMSMLPANLADLFHHYFGRYMIRNVIYGCYKFLSIESPWLAVVIISNITILVSIGLLIKKKSPGKIENRLLLLAAVIFLSFLTPILFNNKGGIGGRHLVLPSIGLAVIAVWLLEKMKAKWQLVFLSLVFGGLIVTEGNAWTQVVACRINGSVYETLKENQRGLIESENIIIDTRSFADNIPFTWVDRDFNVLNTYYGSQAFEDWGLRSMVRLITNDINKPVYIAVTNPKAAKDGFWEFAVFGYKGYRSNAKLEKRIPVSGSTMFDFKSVYGRGFVNGLRGK